MSRINGNQNKSAKMYRMKEWVNEMKVREKVK